MFGILIALAAAGVAVLGMTGYRLVTSTGLEDVEAEYAPEEVKRARGFAALLDVLGSPLQRTAVRLRGRSRLQRLDTVLRRAGRPDGVTLTMFVRREAALVLLGILFGLLFALQGYWQIGLVLFLALSTWMRVWLHLEANKRQQQVDRELPDFLDVLAVTVTAGLGFRQALERVCEFHGGALAAEMRTALREMNVGSSRRQVFEALRERNRSRAVGTFVTALLQAEELGVPLAEALTSIAADVRREHAENVRQRAARAAPMVSLAVTVTILPGALILIVSAVLIANAGVLGGIF
ncbi:type II secretion system F family protein [Myceligenerans pegani]|uniref:Type II secretion system F family protein n=1 Tax=Myceligenerans pegani TaxID=2776917 RepID=A0ABR9N5N5_9MICO|nr:type II secretion system F family protein [Myceligenerans sp. TRM 65318]MBE1878576.1 type II secretion system F family protein [Myceligenerans sp. TRM 65318]MBE3020847.1 type II secretion system F family protein [Myceligenerans sp. TRM 65318]